MSENNYISDMKGFLAMATAFRYLRSLLDYYKKWMILTYSLLVENLCLWHQCRSYSESLRVSGKEIFRFFKKYWRLERVSNPRSSTFQAGSFSHCTRAPAHDGEYESNEVDATMVRIVLKRAAAAISYLQITSALREVYTDFCVIKNEQYKM